MIIIEVYFSITIYKKFNRFTDFCILASFLLNLPKLT